MADSNVTSSTNFEAAVTMASTLAVTGAMTAPASLAVGGGTAITKVVKGSVAVNPASLADGAEADTSVTITGVAVGDVIQMCPAAAGLDAGILICGIWVSAADTVKIRLANQSGGTVDVASATWDYVYFRS